MAVRLTPEQAAEKHNRRTKAAAQDMRNGVMGVTEAPGKKAAAKVDKLRQNWLDSVDSGKWAQRTAAVSLEEWKDRMVNVGVGRVAAGLDAAQGKMTDFYTQLFAHQNQLLGQIEGMPDLTLSDSINRVTAWIEGMARFSRR